MSNSEIVPPSNRSTYKASDKGFVTERFKNIKSNYLEITEDKLTIILMKHLQRVSSAGDWVNPLSLLVTFIIVFITSSFNDAFGISKEIWKSFFIVCTAVSIIWLTKRLYMAFKDRGKRSIEYLIELIKNKNT